VQAVGEELRRPVVRRTEKFVEQVQTVHHEQPVAIRSLEVPEIKKKVSVLYGKSVGGMW
jgi:hypothetical protein